MGREGERERVGIGGCEEWRVRWKEMDEEREREREMRVRDSVSKGGRKGWGNGVRGKRRKRGRD